MNIKKLQSLRLPEDTLVMLSKEAGDSVDFRHDHDPASIWHSAGIGRELANLLTTRGLDVYDEYGNSILEELRTKGHLEDYEPREGWFDEYLAEVFFESAYDLGLFDSSTEHYDYKRGYCTVSTAIKIPLNQLVDAGESINGWTVTVSTPNGTLTLD
jgi:hypothetical protein